MKRLFIWLLWTIVIVGACVAIDQLLLRSSLNSSVFTTTQTFYKDFRSRIITLADKNDSRLEAVVKENWPPKVPAVVAEKIKPLVQPAPEQGGYVYPDKNGGMHFAARLDDIPREYRAAAKPLQK